MNIFCKKCVSILLLIFIIFALPCSQAQGNKEENYLQGISYFKNEDYSQAKSIFEALGNYKESKNYLYKSSMAIIRQDYSKAKELYSTGNYDEALAIFKTLNGFSQSKKYIKEIENILALKKQEEIESQHYEQAMLYLNADDLDNARSSFIEAGDYKDATQQIHSINKKIRLEKQYDKANKHYESKEYNDAYNLFLALDSYNDSNSMAKLAKDALNENAYNIAINTEDKNLAHIHFLTLGDFKDSIKKAEELKVGIVESDIYALGKELAEKEDFIHAMVAFESIKGYKNSESLLKKYEKLYKQEKDYSFAFYLRAVGREKEANDLFKSLGRYKNASKNIFPLSTDISAKQLRDYKTSEKSPEYVAADGSKHVYQIFKGVPTWIEAKMFCESLGGHLATIADAEENAFIHDFMIDSGYTEAYFGLSDEERVGNWEWVTGEPFVFSNWYKGEPSRSPRERYGMFFTTMHEPRTWNDSHFYEHAKSDPGCSFICEWDY
ncbi:MAG: C-type lectin domain-containing protein [Christensenellaceae bacterium]|nr:C-type lectin domain-containing protein [Christensenellaceae bacterium]